MYVAGGIRTRGPSNRVPADRAATITRLYKVEGKVAPVRGLKAYGGEC